MKTVLEQLIDKLIDTKGKCTTLRDAIYFDGILAIIDAGKYLEAERKQIIDAYMGGIDGWLTSTKEEYKNGAEQYYNERFS